MSDPLDQIVPGCDVTHATFGHGVVLEYAAPFEVVVRFDDDEVGDRRLHLTFAPVSIHRDGEEIDFRDALPAQPYEELTPQEEALTRLRAIGDGHLGIASKAIDTATDDHPAQLAGLLLDRVDFSGHRLVGANFTNAHLRGSNFVGAVLTGARFAGADMERTDLSGCDLVGSDFSDATLTDADFSGANLEGANLSGIIASLARFGGANLKNANLAEAYLEAADFTGANLEGASLLNAEVDDATFEGAILKGVTMPDGSIHD